MTALSAGVAYIVLLAGSAQVPEIVDAAAKGDANRVRALLGDGAPVDAVDATGRSALMHAAARGDLDLVQLLLARGADPARRDSDGVSALVRAKAEGHDDVVARLRAAGARESREELLHEAIRAGDDDAVADLIFRGADVNALDTSFFETPLMAALRGRELSILERLLEAGADPSREGTGIETTGENAVSLAARQQSPWALRLLLAAANDREEASRALLLGCEVAAVVRVALEAGADPDVSGRGGETPLMCAASAGAIDALDALLEAGADAEVKDDAGRSALGWALQSRQREAAERLRPR